MHLITTLTLLCSAALPLISAQAWNLNMGIRRFSGNGSQLCRGNNLHAGEAYAFDTVAKECCLRLWENGACLGRQDFEICGDQEGRAGQTFGSFGVVCSRLLPIQRREAGVAAAAAAGVAALEEE